MKNITGYYYHYCYYRWNFWGDCQKTGFLIRSLLKGFEMKQRVNIQGKMLPFLLAFGLNCGIQPLCIPLGPTPCSFQVRWSQNALRAWGRICALCSESAFKRKKRVQLQKVGPITLSGFNFMTSHLLSPPGRIRKERRETRSCNTSGPFIGRKQEEEVFPNNIPIIIQLPQHQECALFRSIQNRALPPSSN